MEMSLNQAHSGTRSGLIPNDTSTDVILNLGNRVQSEWALEFYMYVPTGKEAYWNLQGVLPVGAGEWIVGNIYFNKDNLTPGIGVIDDSALGIINFNYPQDEWFRVAMNFNLTGGMSIATWGISIDNTLVIPEGTPFTNNNGDFATSLGGVDFYSISSNNEFYLDDFNYINGILELEQLLGIDSNSKTKFILFPNPSIDIIHIQTDEVIRNISIYNVVGYKVLTTSEVNTIDVTLLSNGVYFVVVETDKGKSTQKLIKE